MNRRSFLKWVPVVIGSSLVGAEILQEPAILEGYDSGKLQSRGIVSGFCNVDELGYITNKTLGSLLNCDYDGDTATYKSIPPNVTGRKFSKLPSWSKLNTQNWK